MANLTHTVDAKQITLTLRMPRAFGLRMTVATWLLRLAGIVAPITFEFEITTPDTDGGFKDGR